MINNLERALTFVFKWEGGYVDDKDDPGGATKWGIALNRIGRTLGLREKDIKGLTFKQAKEIYKRHYWDTCHCYDLPSGLDIAVFDCSVNQGPTRARKFLQRAVRVDEDGIIGAQTVNALRNRGWDSPVIIRDFMVIRALHYSGLTKFTKYGRGWFNRLFDCHQEALMARKGKNHV